MQKKLMTILAWNETRARALALVLNLFCVLILASRSHLAVAAPSQIVSMEYLFAEAKVELPSQLDNRDWQPFESQKNALSPRMNESLWLRIKVAHSESDPSPTLSFEKIFVRYKLYKDKQLVSEFGSNSGYPGLPPHLITLPADQGNIFYHMRVQSAATRIGPIGAVKIGHRSDFIVDMLKADAVKLFAVSILGLLGVVGLILFFSYRHVLTYLHLAMFSICGMFYLAAGLKLRSVLGINPVWIGNASYIGLYAAPLFFVEFYKNIFALDSLPKYLKVTRFTSLMFLPISLISAPFLSVGLLSLLPAFYAVSVPLFLAVFMHSFRHRGFVEYKRTFHFGFIFLLAAGLWEAANEVRIINSAIRVMPLGMLAFYLALATMQGQFFANLFRTAKNNAQNELIARQRLQRVLNCTYIFAQSRDYRSLFLAVADNISKELHIQDEPHSVDFIFSRIMEQGDQHPDDKITHFTYAAPIPGQPGTLSEVVSATENSSNLGGEIDEKLTSLPGVISAERGEYSAVPTSTLTVPIDFGFFYGAVVVRRYAQIGFSEFEQDMYINFVNSIAASLAVTLKNIDYTSEVEKKVAIDSQLDAARAQQNALLAQAPDVENLLYSAYSRSAGKTGGDWHGCYFDASHRRLFVTVGDVTGHDFASSILTGVAAGAVRAWEENDSRKFKSSSEALVELAGVVNRVICSSSQGLKFMTMIFVCLEVDTGVCHLVSAGHVHPFYFTKGQRPSTIPLSGHILGESVDSIYKAEMIELLDGDMLLLFTDGLFENENAFGEKLQRRKFVNYWKEHADNHELFEGFVEVLNETWGDCELEDDVTLLSLGWTRPNASTESAA